MGSRARDLLHWRPLLILLPLILTFLVHHAYSDPPKAKFFARTNRRAPMDKEISDQGPIWLEFGEISLGDLGHTLADLSNLGLLPGIDKDHPPVAPLNLSFKTPRRERAMLLAEAKKQFKIAFPDYETEFRIRYVDLPTVKELSTEIDRELDELERELPSGADPANLADLHEELAQMHRANQESLREALKAVVSAEETDTRPHPLKLHHVRKALKPPNARKFVARFAGLRAFITFANRLPQAVSGGASGGVPGIASGLALVIGDPVLRYFSSVYDEKLSKIFGEHPLLPSFLRPALIQKLNEWYMNSPRARLAKTAIVNSLMWAGISSILQTLGHWNNPVHVAPVTLPHAIFFFFTGMPSNLLGSWAYWSFEKLRRSGRITLPVRTLGLRAASLFTLLGSILSSKGLPNSLLVGMAAYLPAWLGYTYIGVKGTMLPERENRFPLFDVNLPDRQDIVDIEGLESVSRIRFEPAHRKVDLREVAGYIHYKREPKPATEEKDRGCRIFRLLGRIGSKH